METISFSPIPELEKELEKWFTIREEQFFKFEQIGEITEWSATREGALHSALLQLYVLSDPSVTLQRYTAMQTKLVNKGLDQRGRPRIYRSSKRNLTFRRALRRYLLNVLVSEALGVEVTTPEPSEPQVDITCATYEPVEALEMLHRFEGWTEFQLPRKAFVLHTRQDRAVIAPLFPELAWEEGGELCVKFEDYIKLRVVATNMATIEDALNKEYRPLLNPRRVAMQAKVA